MIMDGISDLVGKSVTDFLAVSSLAGAVLQLDQVDVKIRARPYKTPPRWSHFAPPLTGSGVFVP